MVVALGDSIMAGSPGYEQDPAIRGILRLGHNPRSQWEYWAQRKYPDLQIRNCGVPSERTDEIAQRFDLCATGANAVVIEGGINDLTQGRSVASILRNLRQMVGAGKQEGLAVEIADIIPITLLHPQADAKVAQLNRGIHRLGRAEHVPVLPFHDTLQNPAEPGTIKPAWLAADHVHPSVVGYRRLGEIAFKPPGR